MQWAILLLLVVALGFLILGIVGSSTPLIIASLVTSVLVVLLIVRSRSRLPEPAAARAPTTPGDASSAAAVTGDGAQDRPGSASRPPGTAVASHAGQRRFAAPGAGADGDGEPGAIATPITVAELARAVATDASPAGPPVDTDGSPARAAAAGGTESTTPAVHEADGTHRDVPADAPDDEPPAAVTEAPLRAHGDEPVWVIDGRPRYHVWACAFIVGKGAQQIALRQAAEDGFTPCSQCDPDTRIASG